MCTRTIILVLILIVKIFVFFFIPLNLYMIYKKDKNYNNNIIYFAELFIIIIFILLNIFNNSCVRNSTISKIYVNAYRNSSNVILESNDPNVVEKIVTNKIYKTNNNRNVYYFNHNNVPFSNKKVVCEDNSLYMKHYGNNITAISTLVSYVMNKNIDPIEIMNLAINKEIVDCDKGISTYELLKVVAEKYNLNIVYVDQRNLYNLIQEGNVILAKSDYNSNIKNNISCDISYINIYKVKNNNYYILNPNDKDYDYICPEDSSGYGSIILSKQNERKWSAEDLFNTTYEYITLERK